MPELVAWFNTRVLTLRILGLALLPGVAAIGATMVMKEQWPPIISTILLGALLVISFRLWDDLEDRVVDQTKAPARTIVTATRLAPFWCALVFALVVAIVILALLNGPTRVAPLLLLLVLMAVLYRTLPAITARRGLRDRLVLLKYPIFVCLIAAEGFEPVVGAAALLVLLIVAAFDAIDQSKQVLP